ncbi:MAG: hypothetical protein E6J91_44665 [Deltaproteobacteria bacterium]|nr:MAG: hypothetical protein E6J91_44665 [Deltaproteobacteria bacterium]
MTGAQLATTAALYSVRAEPAIVELARAAVRRLADAAPVADDARRALGQIERVGLGPPYTVAIAGDLAARTELLNWLAGERLFDPARADPDRIVMQVRRGPATSLRARRRDGSLEDHALDAADADGEPPTRRRSPRADRARTARADDVAAFRDAIAQSAEAETRVPLPRPRWWAVWRWLARWWRAWRSRGAPALPPPPPQVAPAAEPTAPAAEPTAPAAEPTAPAPRGFANTVSRGRRELRQDFVDALSACLADEVVERLFVEVRGGPLSDKVVVLELPSRANARVLDAAGADTCLVACGAHGFAMTEQLEVALAVVPHLFAVAAGAPADPRVRALDRAALASDLTEIATIERSIAVGERAVAALASGSAALDAAITRAETGFRARLDRLEALRIASPEDHVAAALARIRPPVLAQVQQLLRRALESVDGAIAELGAAWSARLGEAASTEDLRKAATQIDEESPGVLQRVQADAHRALTGGLTERARVHYRELIAELRRGSSRDDAAPPWLTAEVAIAEMTSSTSLGAVAPRLTSLFRSQGTLKAEALAQLEQRIARLRQVASANILDTEPRLEPAVTGALAVALRGEVERHVAWLEAELARERVAIDAERAQLAGFAAARDAARRDERELVTALAALAAELPPTGRSGA